jgi:4-amino-4-deoxy-L-arabinose transferase-like glycosyltransferase
LPIERLEWYRGRPALIGAALCLTVLWFGLLGGRPLYEPDEGRYAEIPREMLAGGDWVIPHLNALAYLEKPPLQYWITAFFYKSFGESEGTARLCTGLAGYLSLATIFLVGYRLWGFEAGVKALLFCVGSVMFVLLGHQLTLDMSLSLFLLLALSSFLLAQSQRARPRRCDAWMLGCWAAMALAVLTKGLIGVLIPGATLVIYGLWQRDSELKRHLNFRWGAPLFALIAVPWFVLAARANPAFLRFFFIREHFQRFLTPVEHRSEHWWYFLPVLGVGILPWVPQALTALGGLGRGRAPRGSFDPQRVLWVWCVFVWAFFSCSDAKLIPYVLPLVPALALLCAAPDAVPNAAAGRRSLTAGALLTLGMSIGMLGYLSAIWTSPAGRALALELRHIVVWTAALLAAIAIAGIVLARRGRLEVSLAVLCVGWFLAACTILIAAHGAQRFFSAKDLALALKAEHPGAATVYAVQMYDQSLPFYLQHPVVLVDYRDEFTLGLSQAPELGIAALPEFSSRWRSSNAGYAEMPGETYDLLVLQGLPMRVIARFSENVLVSRF